MEGRKDREFVCEEVREIEIDRERERERERVGVNVTKME